MLTVQLRPSSSPGGAWTQDEGSRFFAAFFRHSSPAGAAWHKVARAVGSKDAAACEALFLRHQAYLSLPKGMQHELAFLAMLRDHMTNVRAAPASSSLGNCQACMGSGERRMLRVCLEPTRSARLLTG